MPLLSAHPTPPWHGLLIAGLFTALCSSPAYADDLIIVTDSRHPVQVPANARVIELDRAAQLEDSLSANLPADPAKAAALVRQRLHDRGDALQGELRQAYQGVTDAWSLGITTIPAVVVDQRYVVYGEHEVGKAVSRIARYRETHP